MIRKPHRHATTSRRSALRGHYKKQYASQDRADVRDALRVGDYDRAGRLKNHRGRIWWDID